MGVFKLTEEQWAQIARRYESGESVLALSASYGVDRRTIAGALKNLSIVRRSPSQAVSLAINGVAAICPAPARLRELYDGSDSGYPSCVALAAQLGVAPVTVTRWLRDAGIPVRSACRQTAVEARAGRRAPRSLPSLGRDRPTPGRLAELYGAPGSGYPNCRLLGERFGVCPETIRNWLRAAGIKVRSRAQQARLDLLQGRRPPPPRFTPSHLPGPRKTRPSRAHMRKMREAARLAIGRLHGPSVWVPCAWCGAPVERRPVQLQRHLLTSCSRSHAGSAFAARRYRPDQPRPLIVERFYEMQEERRYRLPRWDYESIECAAAEFALGMGEPEILAVLTEGPRPWK